jgi:WD40 repeat protein
MQCYYNVEHKLSPVEFYSDYFKLPISDLEVKRLQPILSPIPTVAIYSDISDYEFHLRLGFWGLQPQQVLLLTTLSWNWEKVLEELETAGYSVKQSLRTIRTAIVTLHKLLAAFLADAYYLYIDANYQPQLFDLTGEFDENWVLPYLKVLKEIQQRSRQNYQQELQQLADAETKRREAERLKTNAEKWQCINTFAGHANWVCCLAISPDGQILASGSSDNSVKIWNLPMGAEICTFAGHLERVDSVTFSLDGKTLVSTSSDNTVKLWNLRTKQEICTITGNLSRVFPILVRRDKNLDGKTEDRKINLWDLTMGQDIRVLNGNSGRSFPVVISPNGEIIAGGGEENAIKLWNLKTGEEIRTLIGHSHWVNSVAFSPDGKTLASGSVDDTIKLWDLKTGKELRTFVGHSHWVNSVAFSPDGQTLASGSMDRTIKLWSLKTGEEVRSLAGHAGGVISVAMSPDGKTLVSGSTDGIIKIWQCG